MVIGKDVLPAELGFRHPATLLATWFGVGLLPKAPGTWGSLAALPLAWLIHRSSGAVGLAVASVVVFLAGLWAASVFIRHAASDDPGAVVIDEVAGQLMVLVAVPPDALLYTVGFVLFRLADIVKPWPASWADRRLKGGLGVMLDDALAALYAGALLFALARWMEG